MFESTLTTAATAPSRERVRTMGGPEASAEAGAERPPVVHWSQGSVQIDAPNLFAGPDVAACRPFLERIFRLGEVHSVDVDRVRGTATVRYAPGGQDAGTALNRMAEALRKPTGRDDDPVGGTLPFLGEDQARVKVSRYGAILSTWEVVHELPGRVRFRHEALRRGSTEFAARVTRELATVHGVDTCQVGALTASLLVRFDPSAIHTRQLLQVLDALIEDSAWSMAHVGDPPAVRFGLPNTSVALAAAGEFAVPALLPVSALLLVASNLKTFQAAWREVRHRQFGLPVLYTTIIVATLSSGQFLAAALMSWMLRFWRRRHRDDLLATRRHLFPGVAQHRRFARFHAAGAVVEVPIERLKPGDLITILPGELVPADGRVVLGPALIDERMVRGVRGLSRKVEGDVTFAGSRVIDGEVRLEVTELGRSTRAAALSRAVFSTTHSSSSPLALNDHGDAFARKAVVPTLAAAGVGLLVGDLTTAAAVLRPDYATGPGLGVSMEQLRDAAECAREGILVRDPTAFRRLAEVDMVLLDHIPALERGRLEVDDVWTVEDVEETTLLGYAATALGDLDDERAGALLAACAARGILPLDLKPVYLGSGIAFHAEGLVVVDDEASVAVENALAPPGVRVSVDGQAIGRLTFRRAPLPDASALVRDLKQDPSLRFGLLSSQPGPEAEALASALGVDLHRVVATQGAKADAIRAFGERGVKVAFLGDGPREPEAAHAAHVSLSLAATFDPDNDPASVVMLPGEMARFSALLSLARAHVSRVRVIHGAALIPNLACVAGAFFLGFTSLSSVIVTNLGTYGVSSRLAQRARHRVASKRLLIPAGAVDGRPDSGGRTHSGP